MSLRLTGGTARGRLLKSLPGDAVRPTASMVRQALFNILRGQTEGARWLDLFAGSGAVGLEALSRGAAEAVFVEKSRHAFRVLRQNVETCGWQDRGVLNSGDARAYLRNAPRIAFDVAFLDPPYASGIYEETLQLLLAPGWLAPNASVVLERAVRLPAPQLPAGLEQLSEHRYGDSAVVVCARSSPE